MRLSVSKILPLAGVIILGCIGYVTFSALTPGGGGSDQIVPDSAKAGEPITIKFIVSTWGKSRAIKDCYKDIHLYYKRAGQDKYTVVQPEPIDLPENYTAVQSNQAQDEAFKFNIPAQSATGEIEFYFDFNFNGYFNKVPGFKKIKII